MTASPALAPSRSPSKVTTRLTIARRAPGNAMISSPGLTEPLAIVPWFADLAERYDLPGTYAAIGFVILVSVAFFMLLERVEQWLRPAK